jgi:hypothetical protein
MQNNQTHLDLFRLSRRLGISPHSDIPCLLYGEEGAELQIDYDHREFYLEIGDRDYIGGGDKSEATLRFLEEKLFLWAQDEGYFDETPERPNSFLASMKPFTKQV